MAKIYWDANLFIYLFEDGPNTAHVEEIRRGMLENGKTGSSLAPRLREK